MARNAATGKLFSAAISGTFFFDGTPLISYDRDMLCYPRPCRVRCHSFQQCLHGLCVPKPCPVWPCPHGHICEEGICLPRKSCKVRKERKTLAMI